MKDQKTKRFTSIACDLNVRDLYVDDSYQRALQKRHEAIVAAFDEHRFETLAVNERAGKRGKFAVIDGQARLAAARELSIIEVPCRVYDRLTVEQEAALFVKLQEGRKNLRPYDRFRAKERAGYADTIEIHTTVVQTGFEVGTHWEPGIIGAIKALENIYRIHGEPVLRRSLLIVVGAWGKADAAALSSGMLQGLARVLAVSHEDKQITSRLRRKLPSDVFRVAGALADGHVVTNGMAKHVAQAIVTLCEITPEKSLDAAAAERHAANRWRHRREPQPEA